MRRFSIALCAFLLSFLAGWGAGAWLAALAT